MSELISPIQFLESETVSVGLSIAPDLASKGAAGLAGTENILAIERKSGVGRDDENMLVCDCIMHATVKVVNKSDADDVTDPLLTFTCLVHGAAKSPEMAEDEALSERILEANTISFIWAKMRNWMELLTADSAVGKKLTLPAIDPYSLTESDEDEDE